MRRLKAILGETQSSTEDRAGIDTGLLTLACLRPSSQYGQAPPVFRPARSAQGRACP